MKKPLAKQRLWGPRGVSEIFISNALSYYPNNFIWIFEFDTFRSNKKKIDFEQSIWNLEFWAQRAEIYLLGWVVKSKKLKYFDFLMCIFLFYIESDVIFRAGCECLSQIYFYFLFLILTINIFIQYPVYCIEIVKKFAGKKWRPLVLVGTTRLGNKTIKQ